MWRRGARATALLTVTLMAAGCSNAQPERPVAAWQPTTVERHQTQPIPLAPVRPMVTPVAYTPPPSARSAAPGLGYFKIGKPYVVNGITYVPAEDPSYDRVGIASWYGTDFHMKQTANGETFDMNRISAAHPTLPMPSYVYVTNLKNGRTMLVRVNDRGPYKPGRIIDLSRRTAQLMGFEGHGTTEIRVRYAGRAPLDPADDRKERQFLAAQPWNQTVRATGWSRWFGLGMGSSTQ